MINITTIIGARPQFIKAATVSRVINEQNLANKEKINECIIHTGQHFDDNMSEIFFRELEIPKPDYNLGIGGGSHGENTGKMIESIEKILIKNRPDLVMIYGDTDSTLAGALAAVKLHIPVAHIEAGLRSFNRIMPEEINRIVADQLSSYLFCPTETAINNLKQEGYPHKMLNNTFQSIFQVGDVMYDAALFYAKKSETQSSIMQELKLEKNKYVLATIHRAENTDNKENLENIIESLNEISAEKTVVLPLHPRTRNKLNENGLINNFNLTNIKIIEPLGYLDMVMLEKNAKLIITDSGGIQKEAYFHGVPCITIRQETEWLELVDIGANAIAGTKKENIITSFHRMKNKVINLKKIFGSGNSANEIINLLIKISYESK